jgi:hypothetical protein
MKTVTGVLVQAASWFICAVMLTMATNVSDVRISYHRQYKPGKSVCRIRRDFPPGAAHMSKTRSPGFTPSAKTGNSDPPSIK